MRHQIAVNTILLLVVSTAVLVGCAKKEIDPLDELKMLIPRVENGLNGRDLAALQKLGTDRFESNTLVIDVFGKRVNDSVDLTLSRIQQTGSDAIMYLDLISHDPGQRKRTLQLNIVGGERWRIDSFVVIDSTASPRLLTP
jgi:hypothetical protein